VFNASPLILLGKADLLPTLKLLCDKIAIPSAVAEEIRQGPERDPSIVWLETEGSDYVHPPAPLDSVIAAWDLGKGESHAIALARAIPDSEVILDDWRARKCAVSLHIPLRGTLGIVLLARKSGLIPSAATLLHRLIEMDYRIDPVLLRAALKEVNEEEAASNE
jgi:predicted nucleic acid-binding protein